MRMDFTTPVSICTPPFPFAYADKIQTFGSCFAENLGSRLTDSRFDVDRNPFGILYNPASIARAIRLLIEAKPYPATQLHMHDHLTHSFDHHGCFSSPSPGETLEKINTRLAISARRIREAGRLIVTFGTAYVYRHKASGQVVANCHKMPGNLFDRHLLTAEAIVTEWETLLAELWELNPNVKILFTVSPIRHLKDGLHANQLSKATLLLAVDRLTSTHPDQLAYFPAYEIMMDELRDYRFYADDMLHPSAQAVDYLWNRFADTYLEKATRTVLNEWEEIRKALNHRPLYPESRSYQRFLEQTLLKIERFQRKMTSFELSNEIQCIKSKLEYLHELFN